MDALFYKNSCGPIYRMKAKQIGQKSLNSCMGLFTHIALLHFAINPVTIRAVGSIEILFAGNEDWGRSRHGIHLAYDAMIRHEHPID